MRPAAWGAHACDRLRTERYVRLPRHGPERRAVGASGWQGIAPSGALAKAFPGRAMECRLVNPFVAAMFAWQAGTVFTLRSLGLWAEPAKAQARLTTYLLEKQRAFAKGATEASLAALAGADPARVAAAALAPAHRRVRANHRSLTRTLR